MKKATLNRRSGFAGHTTYLRNIQPREGLPARRVAGLPAGLVAGPACASYFERTDRKRVDFDEFQRTIFL